MSIDFGVSDHIRQLERVGPELPPKLAQQILRAGDSAREPLLHLALNIEQLLDEPPRSYAPLHALRLLGEIPSPAMIRPLFSKIDELAGEYDQQLPYMWSTEAPQMIARLGEAAIEPLWQLVDDPDAPTAARSEALDSLSYVAAVAPEAREAIVAGLTQRLGSSDDHELNASLVIALGNLGASNAYPAVLQLYREGRINQEMIPAKQARQLLLTPSPNRLSCVNHPLAERYERHPLTGNGQDA